MSNLPVTGSAAMHEPHPGPELVARNANKVDYEPHPTNLLSLTSRHQEILRAVTALYSGSASESDMLVYAEDAVHDDPLSYCDSRFKIAGQWYGIPKLFQSSTTHSIEVVKSSSSPDPAELVFKLRQEYLLKGGLGSKIVDSLVSLGLTEMVNGDEKTEVVKYHKDMWNEKDYSHQGIGFLFKKLNGDYLTEITQPPKSL